MYSDSDVFCNIFFSLKASKTRLMIHDFYVVWKKSIAKVLSCLELLVSTTWNLVIHQFSQILFWTWTDLSKILWCGCVSIFSEGIISLGLSWSNFAKHYYARKWDERKQRHQTVNFRLENVKSVEESSEWGKVNNSVE